MHRIKASCGALSIAAALVIPAQAQQPSMEEMMQRIETLQRRVDELEGRDKRTKPPAPAAHRDKAVATATPVRAAPARPTVAPVLQPPPAPLPGLLPPEQMGHQFGTEDALRSDLPGLSIRIPGTQSEMRFYGFAKVAAYRDFDGRNQTEAPPPHLIPLANSPADMQGGDFGMTARFSRFGLDTRTPTD
jgi:hypothetical protein